MSIYVVGDARLVEPFELIGVPGHVPEPGREVGELLTELARRGDVRLVLIQAAFADRLSEDLLDQLARKFGCLVLAVPGVGEEPPEPAAFLRAVRGAIGAVV